MDSDEPVVGSSEVKKLEDRVRELERMRGRKTMEAEILREALSKADSKKRISRPILLPKSDRAVTSWMRGESRKWVWRCALERTPAASRSLLPKCRLAPRAISLRAIGGATDQQAVLRIRQYFALSLVAQRAVPNTCCDHRHGQHTGRR